MNTSVLGAIKAIGQEKPAATSEEILERAAAIEAIRSCY